LALVLVILVIFLFLRNLSATAIPSMALPMSIVGTFAVMYLLGYSLDNLSLMALTLSVGFVVDDAIVMLENIVRHMEMGEQPMEAHHGRLWSFFESLFDGLLRVYDRTLQVTLRHRFATMSVSVAVLVATVYLFITIPKGFLPDEDQGQIFIFTEGPQGISFDNMVEHQMALNKVVMEQPYIDS